MEDAMAEMIAAEASAAESKTSVARGSDTPVAVDPRVVAVTVGPPSWVTYTTGRAKTVVGVATEIALMSIEVDCALAKALSVARTEMTERMMSDAGNNERECEKVRGKRICGTNDCSLERGNYRYGSLAQAL
jgi:hypothetical protein